MPNVIQSCIYPILVRVRQEILFALHYNIFAAMWLSVKHADNPVPQIAYGKVLPQLNAREHVLETDPKENEVRAICAQNTRSVSPACPVPGSKAGWRHSASSIVCASAIPRCSISATQSALIAYPKSPDEARVLCKVSVV